MPQPTPEQLQNRLTPTPFKVTSPTTGLWRATGDIGSNIYQSLPDGGVKTYEILNALGGGRANGDGGGQSQAAISNLKSQYGIDFNSLPEINMGDFQQNYGRTYNKAYMPTRGDLNDLRTNSTPAGTTTETVNNTPNTIDQNKVALSQMASKLQTAFSQNQNVQTQTDANGNITSSSNTPLANPTNPTTLTGGTSPYQGPSIVDFLKSEGSASDFNTRTQLAAQNGIQNYRGTADQNTQLLEKLRGAAATHGVTPTSPNTPTGAPQGSPEKTLSTTIAQKNGITSSDPNTNPLSAYADYFKQAFTSNGIPDIKARFEQVQKEQSDVEKKMGDEIQALNNNPWLSEGIRQRQIGNIQKKYEGRIALLTKQQGLYDSLYKEGIAQAEFIAGHAFTAYHDAQVLDQQMQMKAMDIAAKQVDAQNKISTPTQTTNVKDYEYAQSQGYKGSFINFMSMKANLHTPAPKSPTGGNSLIDQINSLFDSSTDTSGINWNALQMVPHL